MSVLVFMLLFVVVFVFALLAFAALFVARVIRALHLDSLFGLRGLFAGRHHMRNGGGSAGKRHMKSQSGDSTVVDTRTPDVVNRKIYGADEGEYVDYEAVNE